VPPDPLAGLEEGNKEEGMKKAREGKVTEGEGKGERGGGMEIGTGSLHYWL